MAPLSRRRIPTPGVALLVAVWCVLVPGKVLRAQPVPPDTLRLGLDEAVALALERANGLRVQRLEEARADLRLREAWAAVLPQLRSCSGYARNVETPSPFAGWAAEDFFGGAPTEWLAFNERARTDGDPGTQPIPLPVFQERQRQAYREAGVQPPAAGGGANPFHVDNRVSPGLNVSQTLLAEPELGSDQERSPALRHGRRGHRTGRQR